ncbi:MAG: ubiquinone/menaquinone biosynthesis methyltransferase [Leptospiraceae bacterium]|nr:ubiquinone/menaquinone biosynthesis methyltransferase [Leptospiraceae bacterium]
MTGFQMPNIEKKADFVRENFNSIAKKYDLFNDMNSFGLHRLWKNQIVKIINLSLSQNLVCLDLCSGTGDITKRLSQSEKVSKIYSVDFSEKMLNIAREKIRSSSKLNFQIGDATNLKEFKNATFDVVTVGFGLRNVNNLDRALKEIFRVLKPEGIFINLDVGKVKNKFVRFFADFYFFKIVPLFGYLIWGGKNDMFDYLPVSSLSYPDQHTLKTMLEKTGYKDVRIKEYVFGNAVLHVCRK